MRVGNVPVQLWGMPTFSPVLTSSKARQKVFRVRCRQTEMSVAQPLASCIGQEAQLPEQQAWEVDRRTVNLATLSSFVALWIQEEAAEASKLPQVVDRAWEGIGGGPADLFFPREFLGTWDVISTLVSVETPLGEEFVPDMRVVDRARTELNVPLQYSVSFVENKRHEVITDRQYNTTSLMELYYGTETNFKDRISWNPNDPNVLTLSLPGNTNVYTRVTKRSEDQVKPDRLDTSEYFEQVFENPASGSNPKVTASRCFTKYKWRSEEEAMMDGGPTIVATQVVSDYLTSYNNGEKVIRSRGQPVVIYTYRMAFARNWPPRMLNPQENGDAKNFTRIV